MNLKDEFYINKKKKFKNWQTKIYFWSECILFINIKIDLFHKFRSMAVTLFLNLVYNKPYKTDLQRKTDLI